MDCTESYAFINELDISFKEKSKLRDFLNEMWEHKRNLSGVTFRYDLLLRDKSAHDFSFKKKPCKDDKSDLL